MKFLLVFFCLTSLSVYAQTAKKSRALCPVDYVFHGGRCVENPCAKGDYFNSNKRICESNVISERVSDLMVGSRKVIKKELVAVGECLKAGTPMFQKRSHSVIDIEYKATVRKKVQGRFVTQTYLKVIDEVLFTTMAYKDTEHGCNDFREFMLDQLD